jgi:hypothetical protein
MRRLEPGPQMLLLIKSLRNEGLAEAMRERSSSSVILSRRSPAGYFERTRRPTARGCGQKTTTAHEFIVSR